MISARMTRLVPRAYRPLFAEPGFRRLLPAVAACDLGDGMSVVTIVWLAVRLTPPGRSGPLIGAAVAAYILPGAVGALALGRRLRRLPARNLMRANAVVRATFLGCVPVAWAAGVLHPALYVALLAASSVLHAWGGAGKYALVAQMLPAEHRPAGNALVSTSTWAATIAGPALAGLLTAAIAPAWLIGLDAVSFGVLAVQTGRLDRPAREPSAIAPAAAFAGPHPEQGPGLLRRWPELLGLLGVTWLFNLCYGPVEVALPLFVIGDAHAGAGVIGLYWAVFGIGAAGGALAVGALRALPLWKVILGIIAGHGIALLSFGPHAPVALSLAGFAFGGLIYGPYNALSFSLFQDRVPPAMLTTVLALRGAVLLTAAPIGAVLAGPLTTALGPRHVLVDTGIAMLVLAACSTAAFRSFTVG